MKNEKRAEQVSASDLLEAVIFTIEMDGLDTYSAITVVCGEIEGSESAIDELIDLLAEHGY